VNIVFDASGWGLSNLGGHAFTQTPEASVKPLVAIVRCSSYNAENVQQAVREAVDLIGGMQQFVRPGQRVLLKPNLLSPHRPDEAITTHPEVVRAVLELAEESGGVCSVGDGPAVGGGTRESYLQLLKTTGIFHAVQNTGAQLVYFDKSSRVRQVPDAKLCKRLQLTEALTGNDVLINIPKMKTHALTGFTGAVKNLFGCVYGKRKVEFHLQAGDNPETFAQILVDVLRAVRPTLSIMDAVVGMDGQGPSAGRPKEIGLILASTDPVALDAVACSCAGIDPMSIPTLRLAHEQGLGMAAPIAIRTAGLSIQDATVGDFQMPVRGDLINRMPKPLYRLLRHALTRRPEFLKARCTGCRECVNICPVKAISGEGRNLKVDYEACIRCYCCQEVCPNSAITIRSGWLRKMIEKYVE
jgi:uncharacterized protein (DUF362 family)/Pyruvate/2-oxoacid:ferredoxin oxidoreductase delta subunit